MPKILPVQTPDGRYLIIEGKAGARLWRASNANLPEDVRRLYVSKLMQARRAVRLAAPGSQQMAEARFSVHEAKIALGERGPPWWTDGAPDFNRHLVKNTPYWDWWLSLANT